MRISRWTSLALAAVVAAVLVTPVSAQEVEIKPAAKVKRDKYVLTAEEIAERPDIANAYDAVKLLRPNFLKPTRAKGGMSAGSGGASRPKIDYQSTGGDGGSSSGSSAGSTPDPYKPSGTEPGGGAGGSSPYGGSSGGASNSLMAVMYLDDVKRGDVDEMKSVLAADIVEIRYMGGTEASGRYGAGHEGGAILVKTKRLGKG